MHRQHCIGDSSLAIYIREAMNRPQICHALIMVENSFDIPVILFYLDSIADKNKQEDDLKLVHKRKNFPITITLLLCKLMDTHKTCCPPIASLKLKSSFNNITKKLLFKDISNNKTASIYHINRFLSLLVYH
jgi:hypothetical protein